MDKQMLALMDLNFTQGQQNMPNRKELLWIYSVSKEIDVTWKNWGSSHCQQEDLSWKLTPIYLEASLTKSVKKKFLGHKAL